MSEGREGGGFMEGGGGGDMEKRVGKDERKGEERVRDLAWSLFLSDLEQGQGSGTAQLRPPPLPLIPYRPLCPSTSQPP